MTKHKNVALDELRILAALMVLGVHTGQKVGLGDAAAVGESEGKKMYVWVVEDNKVHKREVTVNAPTGEAQVLISKGLKPEEKIVIAGVYQLVEGENVKDTEK